MTIDYCVVNELPALLWAVNLGSLEFHTARHLATTGTARPCSPSISHP